MPPGRFTSAKISRSGSKIKRSLNPDMGFFTNRIEEPLPYGMAVVEMRKYTS